MCAAHSAHASSQDSRGSNSPRAHQLPSTAWIYAYQVPRLPHMAPTSHLPDEGGWRRGACLNSSTRHDGPDAINNLCKTSTEGTCPEATTPTGREAPYWPRGLHHLPRWSNPTPRTMAARVEHPQKTNQLPRVGSGSAEQWAQRGPPSKAWCGPLTLIYGHMRSALEGLRRAWRSG